MVGGTFKQDGRRCISKNSSFVEDFSFPLIAPYNVSNINESRINKIERKINNIRSIQSRWPESMHDYSEYDNLWRDLKNLEKEELVHNTSKITSRFYYDDLIVIYCGNYLKYSKYHIEKHGRDESKFVF